VDLDPRLPEAVLITNAHVIPDDLAFGDAEVTFRAIEGAATYRTTELLWTSPPEELDATVLRLDGWPDESTRCPLAKNRPLLDPPSSTYVIGHPRGIDRVMLSIRDNKLLDHDDIRVHYRTPTEGGSSGSPVFNTAWQVVALHHAGDRDMGKLNGKPGTYAANEGIWMDRIATALTQADLPG
jgi:hypothetical protein